MKLIAMFADGGSRSNPGPAAAASILYEVKTEPQINQSEILNFAELGLEEIARTTKYMGQATNNQAEWTALILGLEKYLDLKLVQPLLIFLDSELVTKQLTGVYKIKQPHLKVYYHQAQTLLNKIDNWQIRHIFREFNRPADTLVNQVLDQPENYCT
jgi:ribonuclease HI